MKTCLLCNHQEPGLTRSSPDVWYICGSCIQEIVRTPKEDLAERYRGAVQPGDHRLAYALSSFIPKKIRELYPYKRPKPDKPLRTVAQGYTRMKAEIDHAKTFRFLKDEGYRRAAIRRAMPILEEIEHGDMAVILTAGVPAIIQYFYGSSKGSSDKTELLAQVRAELQKGG
jgi:hypothetical protein